MQTSLRTLLRSLAAPLLLWAAATAACAQGFPIAGKPIRIVVPYPPGGQAETYARVVAQGLGESLGVTVLVETKPGASTAIGALEVQRAAPDGHTLLFTNGLTHTQNPHLRDKLIYDPKLFTPVFQLVDAGTVLTAHPSLPANNMRELIAYAKANPNKVRYASISVGSSSHLIAESVAQKHGIALTHVPYKGSADAGRDLWAGHVDLLFDGLATAIPGITSKRVKALAVTGNARNPALPDVPTMSEEGVLDVDLSGFIGFFGPADMPEAVTQRLVAEMQKILSTPAVSELILKGGNRPAGGSAAQFKRLVTEQYDEWGKIIRKLGIKLE